MNQPTEDVVYLACPHCGQKTGRPEAEFAHPIACPNCGREGKFAAGVRPAPLLDLPEASAAPALPRHMILQLVAMVLIAIGTFCLYSAMRPGYGSSYKTRYEGKLGFSFEYPETYRLEVQHSSFPVPGQGAIELHQFTAQGPAAIAGFAVAVIDCPLEKMRAQRTDERIARDMLDGGFANVGLKATDYATVTRNQRTLYQAKGGGTYRGPGALSGVQCHCEFEILLHAKRQYCLMLIGQTPEVFTDPQGERFLDHFVVR